MNRLADQIQRLQGHNLTVLITGESGTGKDLVARAIHVGSPRSAAMFLPYNCTTTSRELADSQLFGHRRGSFTGAVADQQGLIRSAAGGTLFLDEIGDLPLDIQPKLLRFLEQAEIMPVGETRPQAVDVRVLAATNADLEQRVSEGKFREDLVLPLERDSHSRAAAAGTSRGSAAPQHVLPARRLRTPGQAGRSPQLRHARPVCALLVAGQRPAVAKRDSESRRHERARRNDRTRTSVRRSDGPRTVLSGVTSTPSARPRSGSGPGNLAAVVETVERQLITTTLDRTRGNISESARVLGLTRRGLVSENAPTWARRRDRGYLVTRYPV